MTPCCWNGNIDFFIFFDVCTVNSLSVVHISSNPRAKMSFNMLITGFPNNFEKQKFVHLFMKMIYCRFFKNQIHRQSSAIVLCTEVEVTRGQRQFWLTFHRLVNYKATSQTLQKHGRAYEWPVLLFAPPERVQATFSPVEGKASETSRPSVSWATSVYISNTLICSCMCNQGDHKPPWQTLSAGRTDQSCACVMCVRLRERLNMQVQPSFCP